MARYGMVIDTRKCVGCTDCVVACKTENQVPEGFNRDWIAYETTGVLPDAAPRDPDRALQPLRPPAVRLVLPDRREPRGAVRGRRAGDAASMCIGCKACLASCPYDARFVHPDGYADKCTFCIHRVKDGLDPACVSVCPTHCMTFGDLDDPNSDGVAAAGGAAAPRAAAGGRDRSRRIFYLT